MGKNNAGQRLINVFLQELEERTSAIETDLLTLERSNEPDEMNEVCRRILRAAHSLKGAARLVEIEPIEAVCHAMEDLLSVTQAGGCEMDKPLLDLLLRASDAMADAGRSLASGKSLRARRLVEIRAGLDDAAQRFAANPAAPAEDVRGTAAAQPQAGRDGGPAGNIETERELRRGLPEAFVRVPAPKLDALMAATGELLMARSRSAEQIEEMDRLQQLVRLARRVARSPDRAAGLKPTGGGGVAGGDDLLFQLQRGLHSLHDGFVRNRRAIDRSAGDLEEEVRSIRLQPFSTACAGLERLVRDLGSKAGKTIDLEIKGGETQLDGAMLEGIKDVLRHLVRNAVDHGIESPAERRVAGKPEIARIMIAALLAGNRVTIAVADDGRGLDLQAIRNRARQLGLPESDADATRLIFHPGMSTMASVSKVSGRGMGLDIVKSAVERMRGGVDLTHEPSRGTRFLLNLPLTLGTIRGLLVRSGGWLFAIDTSSVKRLMRCSPEEIQSVGGRQMLLVKPSPVPVMELRDWLGLAVQASSAVREKRPAVLFNEVGKGTAIMVGELVAEREMIVKPLGPRLQNLRLYSGGALLPDGSVAPVLNAAFLGDAVLSGEVRPSAARAQRMPARKHRIIIADDSITTRTLEKTILEGAGFEVAAAVDGDEAWRMLSAEGADLVLADIEMPGLDGFLLTERIRLSAEFRHVPVILLTARESPADRDRGLRLGADAYLVKSAFDQRELLQAIGQLL